MKLAADPRPFPFHTTGARIAVLGYGPAAARQALGLRDAGNQVAVGTRAGGMSSVRARRDGFPAGPACVVIDGAAVIVMLVPDDEQAPVYWDAIEPMIKPSTLLVFGRALALQTRALDPRHVDVVFVAGHDQACRVAVHSDASGRALERAISYARAAFGLSVTVATTTLEAEVDTELAAFEAAAGSATAFRSQVDAAVRRACCSHAPEEARILFYEGLRELVDERARKAAAGVRAKAVSLVGWASRGRS